MYQSSPFSSFDPSPSRSRPSRDPSPTTAKQLLIVDGDADSASALAALLTGRDYAISRAADGPSAIAQCRALRPDLAIIDMDMSSPEAVRLSLHLTDVEKLPFIVYARSTEIVDRVIALQLGADHYLQKPMDHRLLMAYIQSAMRRAESHLKKGESRILDVFGPYQINRVSRSVQYQGNTVRLSGTEFELFWMLVNRFGDVVDRRQLVSSLHLNDDEDLGRAIDQRIFRLRQRLSAAGAPKDAIRSVRGKGFVLTGTADLARG